MIRSRMIVSSMIAAASVLAGSAATQAAPVTLTQTQLETMTWTNGVSVSSGAGVQITAGASTPVGGFLLSDADWSGFDSASFVVTASEEVYLQMYVKTKPTYLYQTDNTSISANTPTTVSFLTADMANPAVMYEIGFKIFDTTPGATIQIDPAPVPEPASLALIAGGGALMLLRRRGL